MKSQRFITGLTLLSLATDARRWRSRIDYEDEPEGRTFDDIVRRHDLPSGLEAADDEADEERCFLKWINRYQRDYKDLKEFKGRFQSWREFNKMVRENNRASELSGNPNAPFMDHNLLSDTTEDERTRMLGLMAPIQEVDES